MRKLHLKVVDKKTREVDEGLSLTFEIPNGHKFKIIHIQDDDVTSASAPHYAGVQKALTKRYPPNVHVGLCITHVGTVLDVYEEE